MSFDTKKLHFSIIFRAAKNTLFKLNYQTNHKKNSKKSLFCSHFSDCIPSKSGHTKLINNKIVKCGSVLCLDKEILF